MNRKLINLFSSLYIISMAAHSVYFLFQGESFMSLVAFASAACGAIPLILLMKIPLSLPIVVSYLMFLTGAQYFGSILHWYQISWWDIFLHFISGILLANVGISFYESLVHKNVREKVSPRFVFLFTLAFTVFCGVVWEIYEFSGDLFIGTTMQHGNTDTMTDLLADVSGGLVIAVFAGARSKKRKNKLSSIS
ncbi:hypothetical protein J9303_04390 [Bacillaceae bacterium Marseille-Q3522]|nr:hypothetical protein [Bacillaceae bacterium Marseille-Q3522]